MADAYRTCAHATAATTPRCCVPGSPASHLCASVVRDVRWYKVPQSPCAPPSRCSRMHHDIRPLRLPTCWQPPPSAGDLGAGAGTGIDGSPQSLTGTPTRLQVPNRSKAAGPQNAGSGMTVSRLVPPSISRSSHASTGRVSHRDLHLSRRARALAPAFVSAVRAYAIA